MRNIFSVRSKLQRKYLRLIELSILLPTFLVVACLYYLVFSLVAEEIAIPEFIATTLYPALERINIILVIGLPILFFGLFWWGHVLTLRLTGPIDRLNRELGEISQGDYSRRISVRKDDDLKSFVDKINMVLDAVRRSRD